ncbi:hypothetical protein IFT84_19395 [Rhizobium sp. CFBP 8762]|uniref:hypothetical protein n=1 Tax=Rhizobium sp. CFBP 8762 TaxID=2775279 RepID=UPI00178683C4|nr:hypothetical protein [Rhizobium sp. CFBP 8762]MBD8556678.1 hypothetical protein [Rhizobium sp. CFBP 8762]
MAIILGATRTSYCKYLYSNIYTGDPRILYVIDSKRSGLFKDDGDMMPYAMAA